MLISIMLLTIAAISLYLGLRDWQQQRPPTLEEAFTAGVMRVGVDTSFTPFAVDVGGELTGLDIDLARAIGDEMGIPVQFVPVSFDGLYDALLTDRVDVLISALVVNPARMRDVRYTRHYYNNGLVLVDERDTALMTMRDLPSHSIAFEYGSIANAHIRTWERRLLPYEQLPYELPRYALDAVRLGVADAALVTNTSYRLYLRDHPTWQPQAHNYTDTLYAIAVRREREATFAWVDAVVGALQRDGRLQAIIERWL